MTVLTTGETISLVQIKSAIRASNWGLSMPVTRPKLGTEYYAYGSSEIGIF